MSAPLPMSLPITPIQKLHSFSNKNEIYIKRDDLLPFCFGGNKARIAKEFICDLISSGCTCMVAYGSPQSNLSRVLACGCSALGIRCVVVSPSEHIEKNIKSYNTLMVRNAGAEIVSCLKSDVRNTVAATLEKLRNQGELPYYIYGDESGQGNKKTPVNAYAGFIKELASQETDLGIQFEFIFLATGTGMTQAGILCGNSNASKPKKIVGISIARDALVTRDNINNYIESYMGYNKKIEIEVTDAYLHGGYGKSDANERATIRQLFSREGIPSDETYVGKAFDGMLQYIDEHQIENRNILFLHTGGTPLYFDMLDRSN